jgi:hypothetical protein
VENMNRSNRRGSRYIGFAVQEVNTVGHSQLVRKEEGARLDHRDRLQRVVVAVAVGAQW